ncbi:mannose-1-phosphate guanylyltransferase [Candidatus Berkelbacteria bacterium]|nr:mannose-1-phosphate guanylyltransferase [Candidatus Berkelbacteria bacterium]
MSTIKAVQSLHMTLTDHFNVVIMAGGVGTRLWPKSRRATPKQFQKIIDNETLLRTTFGRVMPLVASVDHIFVSTNAEYAKLVRKELPELPAKNLIIEPEPRNTAPAMAVAAWLIAKRDPEAIVATAPSDHVVLKQKNFATAVHRAVDIVRHDSAQLVAIGIKPTYPETGYGYIRVGRPTQAQSYRVKKFVEKPDEKTAKKYVESGNYLWNASYFVWRADYFLKLVKQHLPGVYKKLPEYPRHFKTFPNVPVDTAIAEKTTTMVVVPADLGWSDIGSWSAVFDVMKPKKGENVVSGRHVGIDTKNCLIHGADRLIATVGLENIVLVDTGDVILVAKKDRAQDVKHIIDKLREQGEKKYF